MYINIARLCLIVVLEIKSAVFISITTKQLTCMNHHYQQQTIMSSYTSRNQSGLPAYPQSNNHTAARQEQLPAYSEATRDRSPVHVTDEKRQEPSPKKSTFSQIKKALKSIPLDPETPSSSNSGSIGEWPVMHSIEYKIAYLTKGRW